LPEIEFLQDTGRKARLDALLQGNAPEIRANAGFPGNCPAKNILLSMAIDQQHPQASEIESNPRRL
jgi:hypothetical protein